MHFSALSRRAWAAVLVLAAWAASLGWLGLRHVTRTESAALRSEAALRLSPGPAWFGLYSGDALVGQSGITLDTLSPGYQVLETFALDLPTPSGVGRYTRYSVTTVTASLAVTDVLSRGVRAGTRENWVGHLTGGGFALAPESRPDTGRGIAVPSIPTTPAFLPFRLALSGGLVEGRARTIPGLSGWPAAIVRYDVTAGRDTLAIFADSAEVDPASGEFRVAHLDSVTARSVVVLADGPGERWWVDQQGRFVGVESAFGLHWVRTDFDLVTSGLRDRTPARADTLRALYPGVGLLTRADSTSRTMRFLLSRRDGRPIDVELLAPLHGGRQVLSGDTLVVMTQAISSREATRDPIPLDPLADPTDPFIVALAARARDAGGETVRALLSELRKRVVLDTSRTAPVDASDALRTGRGRAEGIARLFVAASNAAGVPARLAIGVRPVADGFESHAWVEVRVQGFWRGIDPAFGRATASTNLIRLASGGSADPVHLLPTIAQLRVTLLSGPQELP